MELRIRCAFRMLLYSCLLQKLFSQEATPPQQPPPYDSKTILKYLADGDLDSAYHALEETFWTSERNPDPSQVERPITKRKQQRGAGLLYTTEYKLQADIEQAEYLAKQVPSLKELFAHRVIPIYQKVLDRIPPVDDLPHGLYAFTEQDAQDGILSVYNKALHLPRVKELVDAEGRRRSLFNPTLNPQQIQNQWDHGGEHYPAGIVVIDDLLSEEALGQIRKLLLESTVFYQTKLPKEFGGYTGAYLDDGLHDRILLELTIQLREFLPKLLSSHPLRYLWAYKYSSTNKGINLHADEAAVNVNIWITPDEANLDPTTGGLIIYTVKPPADWDINQYNRNTTAVYEKLLKPANFANVTVPYKSNRAVLFDSALFHETDRFTFQKGYQNRRINLTILYGEMQKDLGASSEGSKGEL